MFSLSSLTLSHTNFIMLRIYAEALDRLRVRLNMYLVEDTLVATRAEDMNSVDCRM